MSDKLYIKNMVCDRCRMAVKKVLDRHAVQYTSIELGEVTIPQAITATQHSLLRVEMESLGFEVIEEKSARVINQIKSAVITLVQGKDKESRTRKFSVYLSDKLAKDYNYLSSLFSSIEGTTIEQYLIHQKIEKVKELLVYNELSLSGIADQLGYSSVQHLSSQFKKVTGLTPSHFKTIGDRKRKPIDKV